ncbi:telomere repeat binding factor 3 [Actinidia rufa]|uniref:Telomere repeat binding factor 3 n=1 Tax=Actinidia rufa TaxID=165716 RepID=A0A7J0EU78_9ERIC|nr:telomere repeat binding factor 3 [Actinidia rufa]
MKRNYKIAPPSSDKRRNPSMLLEEGRQRASPRVDKDDINIPTKAQIDLELAKMMTMTAQEAAAAAAEAVKEAEAAIAVAEEAAREAEEAEADAEVAQAFAVAAMKTLKEGMHQRWIEAQIEILYAPSHSLSYTHPPPPQSHQKPASSPRPAIFHLPQSVLRPAAPPLSPSLQPKNSPPTAPPQPCLSVKQSTTPLSHRIWYALVARELECERRRGERERKPDLECSSDGESWRERESENQIWYASVGQRVEVQSWRTWEEGRLAGEEVSGWWREVLGWVVGGVWGGLGLGLRFGRARLKMGLFGE